MAPVPNSQNKICMTVLYIFVTLTAISRNYRCVLTNLVPLFQNFYKKHDHRIINISSS